KQEIVTSDFLLDDMKPRFYQQIAIQKTIEAIAKDEKDRVLLTLATGTGKTFIAFQIVYRLFISKWTKNNRNKNPRVLFLADRNILKDQAINAFNYLEKDCVDITGKEIRKNGGEVKLSGNIFFAIYQSIAERKSGEINEDDDVNAYYKQYPSDFFDLVVIDECHRGSANDDSSWREILDYFGSAVHLGLTATPKREDNGDTYKYFGDAIYEYSLKEGINDGFLTPYKVKRIKTNIDEYKFDPDDLIDGELEDKIVKLEKFEKQVIIPKRTKLLAKTILQNIDTFDKTIIFCVNQQHALDMKIAIDKYKKVKDSDYCAIVTSNEGQLGREFLERFQNNDKTIPTILTSSKMLTTGVDAKNVRNVVLTAPIRSMTEFKQIIGRGTRVFEGKDFFSIIDFVGATNLFYDKNWDGVADDVIKTQTVNTNDLDEDIQTQDENEQTNIDLENKKDEKQTQEDENSIDTPKEKTRVEKIIIDIKNKKLKVIDIETSYVGENGTPLRTSEYLQHLIGVLGKYYNDEETLRAIWSNPINRKELLEKLQDMNIDESQLEDLKAIFDAPNSDIYDVLAHLSFNLDIKTRDERALSVKNSKYLEKYQNEKAKEFLEFILDRYTKDGVKELEVNNLPSLIKLSNIGVAREVASNFGGIPQLKEEYYKLQEAIYE
ncbi:MAG: EcoAI/FtnUII family type I restriction enzme subunit R, partial [Poseidonibacter sp.]|uniref:EcoAI/FtnUII family type I restriction enzme subunit R n=1 Tax=Poseidonibacter sp. TaxID=2321188 RepID=UPI00359D2692